MDLFLCALRVGEFEGRAKMLCSALFKEYQRVASLFQVSSKNVLLPSLMVFF